MLPFQKSFILKSAEQGKPLLILILLIFGFQFTGCASKDGPLKQRSEQAYYEAAQSAIDSENYLTAVEQLEQLESRFPFGRYAVQTQLDLIYAYYQSADYTSAALQAERFIRQHNTHPDVDYAYYMKGLANFSTDRGLMARILPTKPSQRDIYPMRTAFSDFSQLLNKFPSSRYASDARQRMIYLRNLLAEHEMQVAQYYVDREAYLAALNRAQTVLANYPQTPAVPDAMVLSVKMYQQLGLKDLALTSLELLNTNYPNHPELDETGSLRFVPKKRLPFHHWFTFGLFD